MIPHFDNEPLFISKWVNIEIIFQQLSEANKWFIFAFLSKINFDNKPLFVAKWVNKKNYLVSFSAKVEINSWFSG